MDEKLTAEQTEWFQSIMTPIYERTDELVMSLNPDSAAELDRIVGELRDLVKRVAVDLF